MKKPFLVLAAVAALLPAVALAHQNGPHASYDVLVPGEVPGLFVILLMAITFFVKTRQSRRPSPFITGLTLALLSGVLLYLSFPPFDFGWLAWVALVPMIIAQLRYDIQLPTSNLQRLTSKIQPANLYQALTIFVVYALVFMHVFPSELPTGFPLPVWPLILLAIALVCLIFYWTGLPTGSLAFHRRTNFRFFIVAPALGWMGMELVRMIVEMGQSWARIPATQHANIPLVQLSTFGGEWLVGALVIATNYALASIV